MSNRIISSLHITVSKQADFQDIACKIKSIMHKHGIHSSTIQPEFVNDGDELSCKLNCAPECQSDWCCPPANAAAQAQEPAKQAAAQNHSH